MASIMKISADQLRQARKAGFKKKAPKKPKRSASLQTIDGYIARHNAWVKEAKTAISNNKKLEKAKKAVFSC